MPSLFSTILAFPFYIKVFKECLIILHQISKLWINEQANNHQLVGIWDKFEFKKNIQAKQVGDIVKFRSITMALWIQKGWQIPEDGLKQTMWNPEMMF